MSRREMTPEERVRFEEEEVHHEEEDTNARPASEAGQVQDTLSDPNAPPADAPQIPLPRPD